MALRLGPDPVVAPGATIEASILGVFVEIGERTRISHARFGDYSYMMEDGQVLFAEIGKFCSIASNVRINAPNHPLWRASQHHFTYRSQDYFEGEAADEEFFAWRRQNAVTIGHDVWIGHGAIIMPGVIVGTGAIIGAGAVVTKAVAAYQIVAGVPARSVKRRFSPTIATRLGALAWWNWPHDDIHKALPDFRRLTIAAFLEKYEAKQKLPQIAEASRRL